MSAKRLENVIEKPWLKDNAKKIEAERTKRREIANSLLQNEMFFEWAGDLMVRVGFFGEGRELTPYQQGARGKIVQELERLCEDSDVGADFLARVFKEKVCTKLTKSTERK
jgi:hypothetical protein